MRSAAEKLKEPVKKPAYIEFVIIHAGEEYRLKTYPDEYPDLRALIMEMLNLEWFGECQGMGRCATCLIEVKDHGNRPLNCKDYPGVTMSCQTFINDDLANVVIQI